MSSLHPLLEKQRQKVQREQRGWILIAVGICLLNVTGIRIIRAVIDECSFIYAPYPGPHLTLVAADAAGWWILALCAWTLVTLACRLRGLATFRGEGVLLLTIGFVIAPLNVGLCIYAASLYF